MYNGYWFGFGFSLDNGFEIRTQQIKVLRGARLAVAAGHRATPRLARAPRNALDSIACSLKFVKDIS